MSKTYKVSINDGKGEEAKTVDVKQGSGANGTPTKLTGVRGYRYELQDDAKGSKLAPDQVRVKRVGKNLHVLFDGSKEADLIIEDYYAEGKEGDNGSPMLVGQAENSGMYEYVPQDPALSSTTTQLKDGAEAVAISLGGGPLPADFVLAGLPVAAAGGIGGWLAGGAAVAAGAAAGGAGGGTAGETSALKVRIINDINNDGYINKDELGTETKISVEVSVPAGAVAGNTINVVSGGTTIPHVLTAQEITAKSFTETFDKPAADGPITVTASFNNVSASDTAKLDTTGFVDPNNASKSGLRVNIDTDGDNDGNINNAENAATITATVSLMADAAVGDVVTVKATNNVDRTATLTQADIDAKKLVLTDLVKPAEGGSIVVTASIKDEAGNKSPTPDASDSAKLNTTSPLVRIIEDVNNDGFINKVEIGSKTKISVEVSVPAGAVAGNTINVVSGGTTIPHVLTAQEITAKSFTETFDKPAADGPITVTASFNNVSASDTAKLDTTGFVDPNNASKSGLRVNIDTDGDNDGNINNAENAATITATVSLMADAAVGDVVTVKATNNVDRTATLTQADIDAKKLVLTDLVKPAEGGSIVVTASIKDEAGNKSPTPDASDSAKLNTTSPLVRIIEDVNNDGFINKVEIGSKTKISVEVSVPAGAVAGNTINVVSGGTTIPHVLTAQEITAKSFTETFDKPAADGPITVTASFNNVSASDTAKLDTTGFVDPNNASKSGLRVNIDTDGDNDGNINNAENAATITATVSLMADAAVGDVVTVKATNNVDRTATLTQADIDAKKLVLTDLVKPAEGGSIVVTASIKDEAGNKSPTPDASDSAKLNTTSPLVRIIEDVNNDGFINKVEIGSKTKISVEVSVPAGAVAGNTINVVSGGTTIPHVLTAQEITAKSFTETFDKPAADGPITVTASFNNVSASDTAKLDTTGFVDPNNASKSGLGVNIDSDNNNNGTITRAEFIAPANASKIKATISLSSDVSVGDVVTVTATGNIDRTFTLTQAQVTAKQIIITDLTPPAEGGSIVVTASIKDEAGNKSPTPNAQDEAVLDTTVPNGGAKPLVEIVTDSGPATGGDKWVNGPELNGATSFSIKAIFDKEKVAVGDKVVFTAVTTTSGEPTVVSKEVEITQDHLDDGFATVDFDTPAKGKNLSVTALIKDDGGNTSESSVADDASLNELTAVADTNAVTARTTGTTVEIQGNVITGTSSGVGKDIDHQFSGTDVFITGVKKGTDASTNFESLIGESGGTVEAEFGTLTIRANGAYDYVLDNSNAKTKALIEGQKVTETFTYKVKDAGGNESVTTLAVEVTGVNDAANVSFKAGSTYSIASNLIRIDTGINDIVVTDADAGQAKFAGVAAAGANFDLRFGSLTLNPEDSEDTSTSKGYAVSYVLNSDGKADIADTLRHDLFTLKSSDGTWKETLDFAIGATGTVTKQEFHTFTVDGLKVMAASSTTTDTLVIDGNQLVFDFTDPTNMEHIEKINISGKSGTVADANTIKLSLDSLMQADTVSIVVDGMPKDVHRLFIEGDSNDKVQLTSTLGTAASLTPTTGTGEFAGYMIYHVNDTHELLVNSSIQNSNVTFV